MVCGLWTFFIELRGPSGWSAWCAKTFGSDQVDRDVDIPARRFRVRTKLVRFLHEALGYFAIDTRQADVEAGSEKITAVCEVAVHLYVAHRLGRPAHISLSVRQPH